MWANGNGGPADDCAADGYSTSIYTIAIGAVSVTGEQSYYDEDCSAKMVVAYVTDDEGYSAVVSCSVVILLKGCPSITANDAVDHVPSNVGGACSTRGLEKQVKY